MDYIMQRQQNADACVQAFTTMVNSMSLDPTPFIMSMNRQHRTLQQSFTRLCFAWIEHCASEEYRTDLRNEQTKKISEEIKMIVEQFKLQNDNYSPSQFLPVI